MQSIHSSNPSITFGAAKDINLRYIMKNRSHLLPVRVRGAVENILSETEGQPLSVLPTLREVHQQTYAPLMSTETLSEAGTLYPEFSGVIDFTQIAAKFSRSAKTIARILPPEAFSLDCLKKIWSGMTQEEIVKYYGFSCRDVLSKLCKTLNIPKPQGNYLTLLKTSEEEGNRKVAEATRRHLDVCLENLAFANLANKTPEARAKQAESMKRFYEEHPEMRAEVAEISTETWRLCTQIRRALADFLSDESSYIQILSGMQRHGRSLNDKEIRSVKGFYKRFWEAFPELKEIYSKARLKAASDVKNRKK